MEEIPRGYVEFRGAGDTVGLCQSQIAFSELVFRIGDCARLPSRLHAVMASAIDVTRKSTNALENSSSIICELYGQHVRICGYHQCSTVHLRDESIPVLRIELKEV